MITLDKICKLYPTSAGMRYALKDVNFQIERGERIGILGGNGAGKSTLIRIIGGTEEPTSGTISRSMTISWPLAFTGGFQNSLTGKDNLRFICRVYGADFNEKLKFVQEFSELGIYLSEPVRTYSAGMRAKLAFAVSLSIDFDCLLIDEVVAVGDQHFQEKCRRAVFDDPERSVIFVSHFPAFVREYCNHAAILTNGHLSKVMPVAEALESYEDMSG